MKTTTTLIRDSTIHPDHIQVECGRWLFRLFFDGTCRAVMTPEHLDGRQAPDV